MKIQYIFLYQANKTISDYSCSKSDQNIVNFKEEYLKNDQLDKIKVPEGFMWGIGASSVQIEGSNFRNDKWLYSQAKDQPAHKLNNNKDLDIHKADIDRVKALGMDVYRMSLDMEIIDINGNYNAQVVQKYIDLLKYINSIGIKVYLTMQHGNQSYYQEEIRNSYCKIVAELFDEYIYMYSVTNEPNIEVSITNDTYDQLFNQINNQFDNYQQCARQIKIVNPNSQIGFGLSRNIVIPSKIQFYKHFCVQNQLTEGVQLDILTKGQFEFNEQSQSAPNDYEMLNDFIAYNQQKTPIINISFGLLPGNKTFGKKTFGIEYAKQILQRQTKSIIQDDSKPIQSEGLQMLLKNANQYKKDIWIAENGSCDNADKLRQIYIKAHVYAISKYFSEFNDDYSNNNFKGYVYWTLVDNWEWPQRGYSQHFGIQSLDTDTFKRTMKQSGILFVQAIYNSKHHHPKYVCKFDDHLKNNTQIYKNYLCDQPLHNHYYTTILHYLYKSILILMIIQYLYLICDFMISNYQYVKEIKVIDFQEELKHYKFQSIILIIPAVIYEQSMHIMQYDYNNTEQIFFINSLSFLIIGMYYIQQEQKKYMEQISVNRKSLCQFNIILMFQTIVCTQMNEINIKPVQSRFSSQIQFPQINILTIIFIIATYLIYQRKILEYRICLISLVILIILISNWDIEQVIKNPDEKDYIMTIRFKILISFLISLLMMIQQFSIDKIKSIDMNLFILIVGFNGTITFSILQSTGQQWVNYNLKEIIIMIIIILCQFIRSYGIIYCLRKIDILYFLQYQYLSNVFSKLLIVEIQQESQQELISYIIIFVLIIQKYKR